MYETYGVDSYHINIGTGDAALHVLVCIYYDGQGNETQKTWVDAILVDAGYYEGHADGIIEHLDSTIAHCNEYYANQEALTVSHIVLTHWDQDHFSGLTSLFERNMREDLANDHHLRTNVYKPSFLRNFQEDKSNLLIGADELAGELYNLRWAKTAGAVIEYAIDLEKAGVNRVDNGPLLQNPGILVLPSNQSNFPPYRRGRFAIGQNLFNLKAGLAVGDYTTVKGPEGLLQENPPAANHGVGMYIVAAGCCVIGYGDLTKIGPKILIDDRVPAENKNNSSIAIMVIFRRHDGTPHIAHYFAGDLGLIVEQYIIAWTQMNQPHEVHTIKLSHHGATDSTPSAMLTTWKPRNVIISAGAAQGYGHPRKYQPLKNHQ